MNAFGLISQLIIIETLRLTDTKQKITKRKKTKESFATTKKKLVVLGRGKNGDNMKKKKRKRERGVFVGYWINQEKNPTK